MGNLPLQWRTQISPWVGFLIAETERYWAETEGEPPIAWAPEGSELEVGDLPRQLGRWEVSYAELPSNRLTGEPMCKGDAKVGKRWMVLVNHPEPSTLAKPTRDNREQRVGLAQWLTPPQSTREREWTMPLILFADKTDKSSPSQVQVKKLAGPISSVSGGTGFPSVPRTWSSPEDPEPAAERAGVKERPTKGANLALMYDLLQADAQEYPEDNDATAAQSASQLPSGLSPGSREQWRYFYDEGPVVPRARPIIAEYHDLESSEVAEARRRDQADNPWGEFSLPTIWGMKRSTSRG